MDIPAGELVGQPFLDLVHPDDLDRTIEETQRHYQMGERSVGFLNRYRHHDGTYRRLEWMSQMAPDRSIAFAVARDVTDRKNEEDRRASHRLVLETRNEALSERVVRDPLTGLHNRRYFDAEVARLEARWSEQPVDERAPVSIAGCAQLGDDRNVSAGLSLADVWLSQAMRAGRNQVVGL